MVWLWVSLACQRGPEGETDPTSVPSMPSPVPDDPLPTSPTGTTPGAVDPCDVPVVTADAPAVTFAKPPANLIVLSIDTLRRDYVDFYGCDAADPVERMPFLTSVLAQSVSLEDVQQCSNWTYPSTNCTLSGTLLSEMLHVPRGGLAGRPVPDGQRTLARLLTEAGFFTGFVFQNGWFYRIANPSIPMEDQLTGNAQGYQELVPNGGGALNVGEQGVKMMAEQLSSVDPPERWFLHLHFIEPHDLYVAPDELVPEVEDLDPIDVNFRNRQSFNAARNAYLGLSSEAQALYREHFSWRYTGDVRLLDERLRTVWSQLETAGLLDDTLVVVWTDHGEGFWERGPQAHGYRLGAEENDAVLAFWHPDLPAARVTGPHHAIDFLPTTLDALGLPVPEDLKGVLAGTAPADRVRYSASPNIVGQRYQAVTQEGFKLTAGWDGSITLYDRNVDPTESVDRFAPDHPRVLELWPLLEARIGRLELLIPEGQRVDWDALNDTVAVP